MSIVLKSIFDLNKKYNLIENLLLLVSIVSVNFISFVAYYDINSLSILDSSAITKYSLTIVTIYVLTSASIAVLLFFFQNLVLVIKKIPLNPMLPVFMLINIPKEVREYMHESLGNGLFRHFLAAFVFIFLYIGGRNFLIILILVLLYLVTIFSLRKSFEKEQESCLGVSLDKQQEEVIKKSNSYSTNLFKKRILKLAEITREASFYLSSLIQGALDDLYSGKFASFFTGKVGVVLIFTSILLGVGRANFVENNMVVQLNDDERSLVIVMTTVNGLAFSDIENRIVFFSSWDNISTLEFKKESKRNIFNYFQSEVMSKNKYNKNQE